eukprot:2809283-Amphidinium_carterae.2
MDEASPLGGSMMIGQRHRAYPTISTPKRKRIKSADCVSADQFNGFLIWYDKATNILNVCTSHGPRCVYYTCRNLMFGIQHMNHMILRVQ